MTMEGADGTASETLQLLQYRLRRIEFLLTGSDESKEQLEKTAAHAREDSLAARLARVENNLAKLASHSPSIDNLLTLRKLIL